MFKLGKIRLGKISYTNMWPVTHFFNENKFVGEVEFIEQVPNQLNKKMALGEIDIGAISSFSYAEQAEKYILLPNLSVSCFGSIGSISLFSKTDFKYLDDKKIALTNTSLTSINLLKIILEEFYEVKPEYISMNPNLDEMMEVADAALLIGDEALLAGLENERAKKYFVLDLGEEWLNRTNHWMTFAVYAIRKEILEKYPMLVYKIYKEYLLSKDLGYKNRDIIIKTAMKSFGVTYDFWRQYFNGLSHDFNRKQIRGLELYFEMAKKIGVISKNPQIEVVDINKLMLQFSSR